MALGCRRGGWLGIHGGGFDGDGTAEAGASGGVVRDGGGIALDAASRVL